MFVLFTKGCAGCWVEYEKGLGYFSEINDWGAGLPRNCDSVSHRKMTCVSFSSNKTDKYTLLGSS
jgi:hypothetical protein